jgi:hypothetical protein
MPLWAIPANLNLPSPVTRMTELTHKPAALLAPFAIALGLATVTTGAGHLALHLRPQSDVAVAVATFAVFAVVLLAIRGLKMDTSYTL